MGLLQEVKDFLNEYKVIGLAVAFIMGAAATTMIQAVVNDLVMPLIGALIPGGDWQTAVAYAGPIKFAWGHFLAALINFLIIAFVVFMIAKLVFKEEKVAKK